MNEDLERIRALLADRQDPETMRKLAVELLYDISSGERTFHAVSHPLGFIYVRLLRDVDWTLRLHLWIADQMRTTTTFAPYQVHMHTWDLSSYVLHGSLENQMITAEPGLEDSEFRVFDIEGQGDQSLITPTEEIVGARVESTEQVAAGEYYTMPNSTFHTTLNPTGNDLITVALVDRVADTHERALGPLDGESHVVVRYPCPPDALAAKATAALKLVA